MQSPLQEWSHLILITSYEIGIIIISILEMRRLSLVKSDNLSTT